MAHHTVLIFRDNGISRVVPPDQPAEPGDQIKFKTIGTAITILIPNAGQFEDGSNSADIGEGGQALFTVGNVDPGVYPYAVHSEATNSFAIGHSSPDLIIY